VASSADQPSTPLRLAIVGHGPVARFHRERIGLRDDCTIVATCAPTDLWTVLSDAQVECVLLAVPLVGRERLVRAVLEAGRHAAVETLPGTDPAAVAELAVLAARVGRTLHVLPSCRDDLDFRAARSVVLAARLGTIRALHLGVRDVSLLEGDDPGSDASPGPIGGRRVPEEWFVEHVAPLLAQTCALAGDEPVSICVRRHAESGAGYAAIVGFRHGAVAQLGVDLDSFAPFPTGWTVSGTRGAYRHLRVHLPADDGEIPDLPVDPPASDATADYDDLLAAIRAGIAVPSATATAFRLVPLVAAALRSAARDEVVAIQTSEGRERPGA
jgi:predicted dehydrogenase